MAAADHTCSIEGCARKVLCRGVCAMHYQRLRYGSIRGLHSVSKLDQWKDMLAVFKDAVLSNSDECIIWPYSRSIRGYATWNHRGRLPIEGCGYVHRNVCFERHGAPPPGSYIDAAHSCAKGHLGCINGKHLRWATRLENAQDTVRHGHSLRGEKHKDVVLTREQVRSIRATTTDAKILAAELGVTATHIRALRRRVKWAWLD